MSNLWLSFWQRGCCNERDFYTILPPHPKNWTNDEFSKCDFCWFFSKPFSTLSHGFSYLHIFSWFDNSIHVLHWKLNIKVWCSFDLIQQNMEMCEFIIHSETRQIIVLITFDYFNSNKKFVTLFSFTVSAAASTPVPSSSGFHTWTRSGLTWRSLPRYSSSSQSSR